MEIRTLKDNTEVKFSEGNHSYYVTFPSGFKERPTSVTTILKVAMEDFNIGAMAGRKNLRETQIEEVKIISEDNKYPIHFEELEDFIYWVNDVNKKAMQKWKDGANRGTLVHNYIQDFALNKSPIYDKNENIATLQKAAENWFVDNVTKVHSVEQLVYNRQHHYAGKYDLEATVRDYGRCLIDYKTGSSLSYSAKYPIQLLAYMEAILEEEGGEPFGRLIVHINRDTGVITERYYNKDTYTRDLSVWKSILNIFSYIGKYNKEWK